MYHQPSRCEIARDRARPRADRADAACYLQLRGEEDFILHCHRLLVTPSATAELYRPQHCRRKHSDLSPLVYCSHGNTNLCWLVTRPVATPIGVLAAHRTPHDTRSYSERTCCATHLLFACTLQQPLHGTARIALSSAVALQLHAQLASPLLASPLLAARIPRSPLYTPRQSSAQTAGSAVVLEGASRR